MTFDIPFPVVIVVVAMLWLSLIAACLFVFRWVAHLSVATFGAQLLFRF